MRILFVAMPKSVHTARWISQLQGLGWDLHLFPSEWPSRIHPELRDVTLHGAGLWRPQGLHASVGVAGTWPFRRGAFRADQALRRGRPGWHDPDRQLARTIRRLKPDVVHSLEMQRSGYLTAAAWRRLRARPPWLYSCWGSDIYFFGKQREHSDRVREVLAGCDYMTADCERDLSLARDYGFRGVSLGVFPGGGGYDIESMRQLGAETPVSARRTIAVKGRHDEGWAGRALTVLEAVDRCRDVLSNYRIVVHTTSGSVPAVVRHMAAVSGLDISVMPKRPHAEVLRLMGRSRIALASSVTDGTPNTLLEAMIMGAFPIQSDTVSTGEWIESGENGLLVPPEDAQAVEAALRRAVSDDALVDAAAESNAALTRERIDCSIVQPRVIKAYEQAAGRGGAGR